jgi:glycosyltransferase involved in cell wall biosynthesis
MEAMAAGCAVVATPIAAAGLTAEARQTMLIAEHESAFADAINSLLGDEARREQLGRAAMQIVRQQYDWSALIPCLLATYRELGLG